NIDALIRRHAPAEILKQFIDMGVQGAPKVAALAHSTDKQFAETIGNMKKTPAIVRGIGRDLEAALPKSLNIPVKVQAPSQKEVSSTISEVRQAAMRRP